MSKKLSSNEYPTWVSDAVVYQIFPDRFRRSGRVNHQRTLKLQSWESLPSQKGFQGGDLYGVIEALDYLQDLGITCIYLNPIFLSTANHRYHTCDYFNVDPILGSNVALDELILELHNRDMKIILDGVFNHCGRGFWAFNDLLENGDLSPYIDWFYVNKWPLIPYPNKKQNCGYACWWNDPALPKFNHSNPTVRQYLMKVATHWLSKGIDGWRLDVPDEIPIEFWVEFRQKIKRINPEAWILGEIWGEAREWLKGDTFDGVMNYRVGWSSLCWSAGDKLNNNYSNASYPLEKLCTKDYIEILDITFNSYSNDSNNSQLNLLDSHDVPRSLNTLMGDINALKIALLLLFLQPGAPCIYYGTEVELSGGKEPKCREPFPLIDSSKGELRKYIRSLTELRKKLQGLSLGRFIWESNGKDGIFGRLDQFEETCLKYFSVTVFINRSRKSWLELPDLKGSESFRLGLLDSEEKGLGPQSAVLMRRPLKKIHDPAKEFHSG